MKTEHRLHPGYKSERHRQTRRILNMPFAPARALSMAAILVIVLLPRAFAQEHTITFRELAELAGPQITLGQVAEIEGPDAEQMALLDLGPVPWPGTRRLVDATVVKIKLFREGFDLRRIAINGDGCIVTTLAVKVSGEEIAHVARTVLKEQLAWPEDSVSIELEEQPADREVAAGEHRPVLQATLPADMFARGKARVLVTGMIDGTTVFKTTVSFSVRVFETVMVAQQDIQRDEQFSNENVAGRRIEVTTLAPADLFTNMNALQGKKASRTIRAGMPITRNVVIVPPVIRRGGAVQIIFRSNNMMLTARGVAREDGVPGAVIKVQNADSGREVLGEVTPGGQVLVSF